MILRLDPPIALETSRGPGWAHFLVDYSQEHNLFWIVFLDESGECWTFQNTDVRIQTNLTLCRNKTSPISSTPISLSPFVKEKQNK